MTERTEGAIMTPEQDRRCGYLEEEETASVIASRLSGDMVDAGNVTVPPIESLEWIVSWMMRKAFNEGIEAAARLLEQTEVDIGTTKDEFARAVRGLIR